MRSNTRKGILGLSGMMALGDEYWALRMLCTRPVSLRFPSWRKTSRIQSSVTLKRRAGLLLRNCTSPDLQRGCVPLITGTGTRSSMRLVEKPYGPVLVNESEADIIAWTWEERVGSQSVLNITGTSRRFRGRVVRSPAGKQCVLGNGPACSCRRTKRLTTWKVEMHK